MIQWSSHYLVISNYGDSCTENLNLNLVCLFKPTWDVTDIMSGKATRTRYFSRHYFNHLKISIGIYLTSSICTYVLFNQLNWHLFNKSNWHLFDKLNWQVIFFLWFLRHPTPQFMSFEEKKPIPTPKLTKWQNVRFEHHKFSEIKTWGMPAVVNDASEVASIW